MAKENRSSSTAGNTELVLYGLPRGATERYEEVLLLTHGTAERIARCKELATADGFHSFREAVIDLRKVPDFGKTVNKIL